MRKLGSFLTLLTGIAFLGVSLLIATGYVSVVELAAFLSPELQLTMPALWLIFSFNLAILGVILFVVALRPAKGGPFIVMVAALGPLSAAGLLARGVRYGGPVPVLLGIGGLSLVSAAVLAIQVRLRPKRAPLPEPEPEIGPLAEVGVDEDR